MKRKPPNLTTKLAATLLLWQADRPHGVTLAEAKNMTAEQFLSLFQWDHDVLHAWTRNDHFSNFTPRLIKPHRIKSGEDKAKVEKAKRVARGHEEFRRKLLAKTYGGLPNPAAGFASLGRRKRKMPSRPFPKGKRPMRRRFP